MVADFGIAHFVDKDTVTSVDSHPGAYKFAPPEYEHDDEEPTAAFDVFSLGAVIHCALVGQEPSRPYRALRPIPPIRASSGASHHHQLVDELISRMTVLDRTKRIQSMEEAADAIDAVTSQVFGGVDARQRQAASDAPQDGAKVEPNWYRPGHLYWLGNNIVFAALALEKGHVAAAMREWNFAVQHARHLPIPEKYVTKLRDLMNGDLLHEGAREAAIGGLVDVAADIGVFIASGDPTFDDLAAPWTRDDPRRSGIVIPPTLLQHRPSDDHDRAVEWLEGSIVQRVGIGWEYFATLRCTGESTEVVTNALRLVVTTPDGKVRLAELVRPVVRDGKLAPDQLQVSHVSTIEGPRVGTRFPVRMTLAEDSAAKLREAGIKFRELSLPAELLVYADTLPKA